MRKQLKLAIASKSNVELPDGTTFNLDSQKGREWLEAVVSFRFQSCQGYKSFTARRQKQPRCKKWHWYGSRKIKQTPRKKYIGIASPDVITIARLEEIAKYLTDLEFYDSKGLAKNAIQLQGDKERKLVDRLVEQSVNLVASR